MKEKTDKLDYIKIKNAYSSKDTKQEKAWSQRSYLQSTQADKGLKPKQVKNSYTPIRKRQITQWKNE